MDWHGLIWMQDVWLDFLAWVGLIGLAGVLGTAVFVCFVYPEKGE